MSAIKTIIFLLAIILNACVSRTDYEKVAAEREVLAAQLEEERFGAAKLLQEANAFYDADDMQQAAEKVRLIQEKHGDKAEAIEAAALLIKVNNRSRELAEEAQWQRALNSDALTPTEDYLAQFPSGRYIQAANLRLGVLKQKQMEADYQNAASANSSTLWKQFLSNYPGHPDPEGIRKRIIKAEVDEIFQGDHGQLPSFESSGWGNSAVSTISITNGTSYELTIRYSGPDTRIMEIPAGATESISLPSGYYRIAASVNASNVRNYAGTENLSGSYESRFYISNSYY